MWRVGVDVGCEGADSAHGEEDDHGEASHCGLFLTFGLFEVGGDCCDDDVAVSLSDADPSVTDGKLYTACRGLLRFLACAFDVDIACGVSHSATDTDAAFRIPMCCRISDQGHPRP